MCCSYILLAFHSKFSSWYSNSQVISSASYSLLLSNIRYIMGRNRINPTSEMIDQMHKSDQYIGLMKPWVKVSSKPIEKDKKYFCVATWGSMHLLKCPKFMWLTSKIGTELHGEVHGEHLVGETRQVCNWGIARERSNGNIL